MFEAPLAGQPAASLRPLEPHHAEPLFALVDANRARLREWLPWVDATQGTGGTDAFIRAALAGAEAGTALHLGIWVGHALAGVIGAHRIDAAHGAATLGYWIGAAHEGRGLMSAACRQLISYLLNDRGLQRIEIRCATGNVRSRAIPERLGFAREGVLRRSERLADGHVDQVVYGLLREEWSG